jgi:hypothetical protein
MKKLKIKNEHYSRLKLAIRIITLIIAIWALIVAYMAKNDAEWISNKQEVIIEKLLFKNHDEIK